LLAIVDGVEIMANIWNPEKLLHLSNIDLPDYTKEGKKRYAVVCPKTEM